MPGRYSGRRRYQRPMSVVTSIKNVANARVGITAATSSNIFAKAVTSPSPTVQSDVSHGCIIKAVWMSLDFCGLAASGVLNVIYAYIIKNPGNNLTNPAPISVGTSNEKKYVFRQWTAMSMRNQEGNPPYHWEGWIRIPKRYQRMGTDDTLQIVFATSAAGSGHASFEAIYKWYR